MTHRIAPSVDDHNAALPRILAARMASILFMLSGVITSSSVLFPPSFKTQWEWVFGIGVAGILIGMVSLMLPWPRWPRSAMLLYFVPVAFVLISLHNFFGGADPYRYSIFYMVVFLWIGIAHPRGTAFWFIPLFAFSYLTPLLLLEGGDSALSSVFYTLPVCLFVSESLGWVAERLRKVQTTLFQSEVRFRSLVQHASDMVLITDGDGMIRYLSPSVERILGYDTATLLHTSLFGMVHPDDVGDIEALFSIGMHQPGVGAPFECRVRHHDSTWRYIETISTNLLDEPNIRGIVLNSRDVTERKALEAQLTHQAFHDPLTGLVNRAAFSARVEHALTRVERKGTTLAVLFLDLDNFKLINDRWGHAAGDQVLIAVAARLHECLRASDAAARLGGDEFAILLEDVSDTANVMQVADRLLDALRQPFPLGEHAVHVGVSIGITWSHAGQSAADLLRHADIAMYSVKHTGKGRYATFDPPASSKRDGDTVFAVSGSIHDNTPAVRV